jgi:hypothetical protein
LLGHKRPRFSASTGREQRIWPALADGCSCRGNAIFLIS